MTKETPSRTAENTLLCGTAAIVLYGFYSFSREISFSLQKLRTFFCHTKGITNLRYGTSSLKGLWDRRGKLFSFTFLNIPLIPPFWINSLCGFLAPESLPAALQPLQAGMHTGWGLSHLRSSECSQMLPHGFQKQLFSLLPVSSASRSDDYLP